MRGEQGSQRRLTFAGGELSLSRPRVMAIVNMTPDSFSDGGRFVLKGAGPSVSVALRQCARWLDAGADILDLGGESTRPGSDAPGVEAETQRVVPLVRALRKSPDTSAAVISVDTRHAAVARAALDAGAQVINDVSGLADPEMAPLAAQFGAGLVIGHMRGTPKTMQRAIHFDDLFAEVGDELHHCVERAVHAGLPKENILVDPCIGFGKTAQQSAALIASSALLEARTGRPVLIGASRKSFLSAASPELERLTASVVAAVAAAQHGARVLRVHDVEATVGALKLHSEIEAAYAVHRGSGAP